MPYAFHFREGLFHKLRKIKKKDPVAYFRIFDNISKIVSNPYSVKPLRSGMKGIWEVHIGHFILSFTIDESKRIVKFVDYVHKDRAYI